MPAIISSTKLRNEYNEVSRKCHEEAAPVFVTRNGSGDLVVMSVEVFEALSGRARLVHALAAGHQDAREGRTLPADEALLRLREDVL